MKIDKFDNFKKPAKNLINKQITDFAKNKVDYNWAKIRQNGKGLYDYTFDQYERPRRVGIWYSELKYGSTLDDIFYKNLVEVIRATANSKNQKETLKDGLTELVNSTTIGEKENGHLLRYAWYYCEGMPFSSSKYLNDRDSDLEMKYRVNPTIKELGEIILPFVKNFENDRVELNKFDDLVGKIGRSIRDKEEKEQKRIKKLTITVTLKQLISLIKKSTLDSILKDSIVERLKDTDDILEVVEENAVFCDMDACFECYEKVTGTSPFDAKGNEKADVEPFIIQHFKNNLIDFPFNVCTEDYITIYEKTS